MNTLKATTDGTDGVIAETSASPTISFSTEPCNSAPELVATIGNSSPFMMDK